MFGRKEASKDSSKQERQVSTKGLTREDVYKKPPLAQLYDKMNPGDYTIRQDFYHSLFIFAFIFLIFACLIVMGLANYFKVTGNHEDQLIIPDSSFVSGQESTVTDILLGYGFTDISYNDNGDIVAWGSADMVQQYKDSFYDKRVKPAREKMRADMTSNSIESIKTSDDYRTLTICTYRDMTYSSSAFSRMVEQEDVAIIIETMYEWCGIRNDGEKMTTRFVNVMNLTDGTDGTQYWETQAATPAQMVAQLEREEKAKLEEASEGADEGNSGEG